MWHIFCYLCVIFSSFGAYVDEFHNFKNTFKKKYESPEEEQARRAIFLSNLEFINSHNDRFEKGLESFTMGTNQFADLTLDEFVKQVTGVRAPAKVPVSIYSPPKDKETPDVFEWISQGGVSKIKNQGICGSCWAYSTTGSLEGAYFLKYGELITLSEENLIDCSSEYGNFGCLGGYMVESFQYVADNGIESGEDYKNGIWSGECQYNETKSVLKVEEIYSVEAKNIEHHKAAIVNEGPLAVTIDAESIFFQFYLGGLYNNTDCLSNPTDIEQMVHAVVAVGYNETERSWLIKNSWDTFWGEAGYMRIAMDNDCGVTSYSSFATVTNST